MKKKLIALVIAGIVALTPFGGGVNAYAADETSTQVADDFLSKNGLEVTPNGKVTLPAAVCKYLDSVDKDSWSIKRDYYSDSKLRSDTVEDVEAYVVVNKYGCGVNLPKNHVGMIFAFRKDGTVAWSYGNAVSETANSVLVDTRNVDYWGSPIDEYIFMFCPLTNSFYENYADKIINFEGEKLPFGEWVKYPTIISNKGRYMARFYANKNTKSRVAYYTINGKIATAEEVELIASGRYAESKHTASAKQSAVGIAPDDQCKPFNKYFEDIILVTFNGTTYCGDKATATKVAI